MSRTASILLVIGSLFAAQGCDGIEGNGRLVREQREVPEFTAIHSDGPLDVKVRHGDQTTVVVVLDSNLLAHVHTDVHDQTLDIRTDAELLDSVRGPQIIVSMPHLLSVVTSGTGSFNARTFDETETIRLAAFGSGSFVFDGSAPRIEAVVEDSGDMYLSGTAGDAHLVASGSGELDARDLQADSAYVRISNSGGVTATVDGRVDLELSATGNADLYGAMVIGNMYLSGTGEVRRH